MGYSTYLFATPSAVTGAGRLLDLFGVMDEYNEVDTPAEADLIALAMDMIAAGVDLAEVIAQESPGNPLVAVAADA